MRKEKAVRGWWGLSCWNSLSLKQQRQLVDAGYLEIGYSPEGGGCVNGAEIAIECENDVAPGPRFYCRPCAIVYLTEEGRE